MSEMIHFIKEMLAEYGLWGLIFVSFADSSFFPIPPDFLLIPMGIANPNKALFYAFITTVASVLGAIFGWYIGKKIGRPFLKYIISEKRIATVEHYFNRYGSMAILIAGLTPIPYKVFTIFAGILKVPLRTLVIWSIIARGLRFFLEAAIILALGEAALPYIEENFGLISIVGALLIIILYTVYVIVKRKNASNSKIDE